jgi:hypothetical protein
VSLTKEETSKVQNAKDLVDNAQRERQTTDKALSKIKDPKLRNVYALKVRKLREDQDGILKRVTDKFVDAWNSMKSSSASSRSEPSGKKGVAPGQVGGEMGFVMFVPFAVKGVLLAAAAAVAYAAVKYAEAIAAEKEIQKQILNDTQIPFVQKVEAMGVVAGSKTSAVLGGSLLTLLLVGGAAFFLFTKAPFMQKMRVPE